MIVYQTRMHPYAQVLRRGTNILRDVLYNCITKKMFSCIDCVIICSFPL